MAPRILLIGLALLALAGCAIDPEPPAANQPVGANRPPADSPGAICTAWLDAMDKGDFEAAVACLAPEAVKGPATYAAWEALECRDGLRSAYWGARDGGSRSSPEKLEARARWKKQFAERIDPVLRKHGLTRRVSAGLKGLGTKDAAFKAVGEKLRDPEGFLARYRELTLDNQPIWRKEMLPRPRLVDVVINGNKAEGKLGYTKKYVDDGNEHKYGIAFVRLPNGDWRVDDWNSTAPLTMFFDEKKDDKKANKKDDKKDDK
jgi:hypothetical protein